MLTEHYKVIGVMSGTSLDGIDISYSNLSFNGQWSYKIIKAITIPYNDFWKLKLANLASLNNNEIALLDIAYSNYLSKTIANFIAENAIEPIDLIASHGHTAKHLPHQKITYQIGNLPEISTFLKQTVVCDFRVQDVQLGGQGAPLVPIGDELLFNEFTYCVNLGGFSNISFKIDNKRIAYDVCPVNTVLNHLAQQMDLEFDLDGNLARTGAVNQSLLGELNNIRYYHQPYPKSLGVEWVHQHIWPIVDTHKLAVKDLLCTFVEHIAIQIAQNTKHFKNSKLLFTGGGTLNTFLMERISVHVEGCINIPDKMLINFKESLIFSLLGVLKLKGEINCLSSVTGAKINHSSGKIFRPKFN